MAFEIKLPRLGWDMEEGSLAEWLKKDGDFVNSGEPVFSVEGDKAVQEIESLDSGILKISPNCPPVGQKVPIGTLLGYLVPVDELDAFQFPAPSEAAAGAVPPAVSPQGQPSGDQPAKTAAGDQEKPEGSRMRIYISPYARRLAEDLGVDWQSIKGSGLRGRIMAKDIQQAASQPKAPGTGIPARRVPPPIPTQQPQPAEAGEIRQPMTQVRKRIADQMSLSAHTTAPVTLTSEVDATELVKLRGELKKDAAPDSGPIPTYNDLLVKLCARALAEHPLVNARIEGEDIVQSAAMHIAVAVDTDRGLMVPVVRNVERKTLHEIALESAELIDKARSGRIDYGELQGATFTITNLGMFDIDAFTPIINPPQCAILGVGRIAPKQVVTDFEGQKTAIRQMVILSLTFDHRLIDGAQAARFLQRVRKFVETPYLWLGY